MLPHLVGVSLMAAGTATGVFCHLRHIGLTVLVLLAPLPGLALVLPFLPFWALTGLRLVLIAYAMSLGAGLLLAGEYAQRVCEGAESRAAVVGAYRRHGLALGAVSLAAAGCLALAGLTGGVWPPALSAAALAAAANGTALVAFYFARFLPCREDFVARSNRAGERWHRRAGWLTALAQPRWGYAIAGIALVLAALGAFGAQPLTIAARANNGVWFAFPPMAAAVLAALSVTLRDRRAILATALSLPVPILLGLWGLAKAGVALNPTSLLLLLFSVGAGMIGLFASRAAAGRCGDGVPVAAASLLRRDGRNLFYTGAIPSLVLLLSVPVIGDIGAALAVAAGFTGTGALLFRPAFAAVIESWLPRVATPASRYRLP